MSDDSKILRFINLINREFNDIYEAEIGESARIVFFDGGSFYYAKMLESVFPGGELYFSANKEHCSGEVLYKIGSRLYYVDGFVEEKNCKGPLFPLVEHPEFMESISLAEASSSIEYNKAYGYLLGLAERLKPEFGISNKPQTHDSVPSYIM